MTALAQDLAPTLAIPDKPRVQGPLLARRVRLTVGVFAVVAAVGLVPSALDWSPAWRAFGLGLVAPGGGFVYTSDPVLALVTLVAAVIAFTFFLFMRANHVALPAVWLLAAVGASLRTESGLWSWATWAVPLSAVVFLAVVATRGRLVHRAATVRSASRNSYLSEIAVEPIPAPEVPPVAPELTPEQLATQRAFLDLALQPVDEWGGFDDLNQYQMGAYRYQCNFPMWAIALAQYTRTPAFQGYVNLAQRNLIEKMTQRRVWEFWRKENLFGNLDANPDPVRRDNIMYSGYYSLMLEVYASNTGDLRYEAEGSLPLRWNGRRSFSYDAPAIAAAVTRNFDRSGQWTMFGCEPGFVFPACNSLGMSALTIRDRRLGTDAAARLMPGFRRTLDEELTTADGRIISNVFSRYGISNTLLNALAGDAGQGLWLAPLAPDVTARTHEILRRDCLDIVDGRVSVRNQGFTRRFDTMDPGNSAKNPVFFLGCILGLAQEIGDAELAAAVLAEVEHACPPTDADGRRWFPHNSVFTNAYWAIGALGRKHGWHDLVRIGMPSIWRDGPVLVDAPYPDVLVARAVSDGTALELVVQSGNGAGRFELGLAQLAPDREYRVTGAVQPSLRSDAGGRAAVSVDLDQRREVRVVPA